MATTTRAPSTTATPPASPRAGALSRVWVVPPAYRVTRGGAASTAPVPPRVGAYPTTSGDAAPPEAIVRAAAQRHLGAPATPAPAPGAAPVPTTSGDGPEGAATRHDARTFTRLAGAVATAFSAARAEAIRRVPWFAKGILQLRPIAVPGYGTFGVTRGKVLLVDTDIILAWCYPGGATTGAPDPGGMAVLADVLAHEALHPFLNHAERALAIPGYNPARDHYRANVAADMEIHSILFATECVEWPWRVCHAQGYELPPNRPMEWYFANLPADVGGTEGGAATGSGDCGAAASGYSTDTETEADRRFGASPEEAESERRIAAASVAAYAKNRPGTVPGDVMRHVEGIVRPIPIPWKARMAARVAAAIDLARRGEVRTYLRGNRKQGGLGWGAGRAVLAASRAPQPRVWVAVDTSGSMSGEELAAGLGVVLGVLARSGAAAVLAPFDAALQGLTVVAPGATAAGIAPALKGGGGSDVRPVFDAAADPPGGLPRPGVLIVFTDGYITVPEAPPRGLHTVWVTGPTRATVGPEGRATGRRPAPWGDHVEVDLDAGRVVAQSDGAVAGEKDGVA